ncbi:MAG: insulinase family protein, partial [Paludibacter sp.]|nr:insulinase family protein [Paludibacter sp.]
TLTEIFGLKISELTGEIIRATDYELDIHYVGKKSFKEVVKLLGENLPLKEGVKTTESPFVKECVTYDKPTIYFLPNKEVQQAQLYFYFNGKPYSIDQEVDYNAFVEYFSGSFNGLVMQEIREKNSMAYTASAGFRKPPLPGKNTYFLGYIGTQSDKAADAIDIFMRLLNNMPQYQERIGDIKMYLKQAYLSGKPSFRNKSRVFDDWLKLGYTDDPAKVHMDKIDNLQFSDIIEFYEQNVKNKNVAIVIMGDPKIIDLKRIETSYGKITKLSTGKLFSKE